MPVIKFGRDFFKAVIYVEPVGKARPRVIKKGDRVITYTPHKTANTESLIREVILKVTKGEQVFDAQVPIHLTATFYRVRPKSTSKKRELPVTRPDWDNYAKLLTDALEKFLYPNDSQITTALIKKRFGSPPRIELVLSVDTFRMEI